MHYQGLKPKLIREFIDEYKQGNKVRYCYCKEDTQEAINKLYSLSFLNYADITALFDWFLDSFEMRRNLNGDSF